MPLFRKSDVNYKARLESKLCLAKETPEPSFDLSECNLTEVPSGVYSMCRVFRKDALLLQNNSLSSLRGGGSLKDLSGIQVLNLESNQISHLPEEMSLLSNLVLLNLRKNKLKKLCHTFSDLVKLKTVVLSENYFRVLPSEILKLNQLQSLDISGNKVTVLPKDFCHLKQVNELILDTDKMEYPSKEICQDGREAIMKYLCQESGVGYEDPNELPNVESIQTTESPKHEADYHYSDLQDSYLLYQKQKERRRQDLLDMEESMRKSEIIQAEISAGTSLRRLKLLDDVVQEQERLESEIYDMQVRKDSERQKLLEEMTNLENHSAKLIADLLELNERHKSGEAILQAMERDRLEAEELFMVKKEELEMLRRKDILDAMQNMLKTEEKQRLYQAQRLQQMKQFTEGEDEQKLFDIITAREQDQKELVAQLLEEDEYQRVAFHVLQVERDKWHVQLCQQIRLVEIELARLTGAERKKKDLKVSAEMTILAERRETLAKLLCQLLEERDQRELELKKRVKEMEERRAAEMKDYWLIQYQRLLDRIPQELTDMEYLMDPEVKEILTDCGAQLYIPILASKQAMPSQLLTERDLLRLGVADPDVRESIINLAQKRLTFSAKDELQPEPCVASAPDKELSPTAPAMELWLHEECVICLDRQSEAVFLPCGHICSCWICSEPLTECPLCRAVVLNKIPADT